MGEIPLLNRRVLWRLLAYLRPYRVQAILLVGCLLLSTLGDLAVPWTIGRIVDDVLTPGHRKRYSPSCSYCSALE